MKTVRRATVASEISIGSAVRFRVEYPTDPGDPRVLAARFPERWDRCGESRQDGRQPVILGTVGDPETPSETKPSMKGWMMWDRTMEGRDDGLVFALDSLASQPLRGRYRLRFRYAFSPWTLARRPATIYTVYSSPFEIDGKR